MRIHNAEYKQQQHTDANPYIKSVVQLYKQTVEHLERHLFHSGDFVIPRWFTRSYSEPAYLNSKTAQTVAQELKTTTSFLTKVEANFLKKLIDQKTNNFI